MLQRGVTSSDVECIGTLCMLVCMEGVWGVHSTAVAAVPGLMLDVPMLLSCTCGTPAAHGPTVFAGHPRLCSSQSGWFCSARPPFVWYQLYSNLGPGFSLQVFVVLDVTSS
jgi:hypothetical protein